MPFSQGERVRLADVVPVDSEGTDNTDGNPAVTARYIYDGKATVADEYPPNSRRYEVDHDTEGRLNIMECNLRHLGGSALSDSVQP